MTDSFDGLAAILTFVCFIITECLYESYKKEWVKVKFPLYYYLVYAVLMRVPLLNLIVALIVLVSLAVILIEYPKEYTLRLNKNTLMGRISYWVINVLKMKL
jgi:hypothetical protein